MANYAKTQGELAEKLRTSRPTIVEAARLSGAPKKTKQGYNVARWDAHLKKHNRGPYRKGSGGKSASVDGVTLTEANIRRTLEQAENERIKKERQLVEQAAELKEIIFASEVAKLEGRRAGAVGAVQDGASDSADRAMPEVMPTDQKTYTEIRQRVMGIFAKLKADTAAAMRELS